MGIEEIPVASLDSKRFIEEQARIIAETVGQGVAINALSGEWILQPSH